jgi:thioredoxin reductase/Pyruvate/2-oxoacid:ferredoxin oxidoreductase delta subunit
MNISSDLMAWGIYGVPVSVALLVYLRNHRARAQVHGELLQESIAAGLTEPPSLHPVVDVGRCIGSSACVKACPEEALGVVDGKATLIGAAHCIGHGACLPACPVEAIKLVFGTQRRGIDIPVLKPNFESNVPGIYIAGELGGMGLIRKAAEQGRQAVQAARAVLRDGKDPAQLDMLIVGAGPAGIGAGLAAIEAQLDYKIVEQEESLGGAVYHYPRNKVTMTAPVVLPIVGKVKMTQVSKEELLEFWNGIVARTGLQVSYRERMESIEKVDNGFVVKTARGSYRARTVLLAIGRRGTPRKLDVPGEDSAKVVYRLVDPEQYQGQRVLVVGGGDSALEAAVAVAEQQGARVTLSYRSSAFSRVKERNRLALQAAQEKGRLRVLLQSTVARIEPDKVQLRFKEEPVAIRNDSVIVCAGGELPTALLKKIGVLFETHHGE